jgi:DNA-binding SARP family transcriptional activator
VTRFRTQKSAWLLAYLAYHSHRSYPREFLIELLWPDCDIDAGRHRLSVALSSLRSQLALPGVPGPGVLIADNFSVGLNGAVVTTDVAEFEAAVAAGLSAGSPAAKVGDAAEQARVLVEAVELYRGPLLPGHYHNWVLPEQQRLQELFAQALHRLIALLVEAGDLDRALPYALRAVSAAPLREDSHSELIRLYASTRQPAAALRQYHELERILQEECGETPSESTRQLVEEIRRSAETAGSKFKVQGSRLPSVPALNFEPSNLEPIGGAVLLDSPFYVERLADGQFRAAVARGDSIVLVKGISEVGKTSLLARGLQHAREMGARVVLTDLQRLNADHLASAESFCRTLAQWIADQVSPDVAPEEVWHPRRGPSANLHQYLRRAVLDRTEEPVVWALDEVDRLFECTFGSEIFRLFRSWHNERAMDPSGPWRRLTLGMAYATEVHLFITDLNQSPFNVGTQLTLEDFTLEQLVELNRRYASPLTGESEVRRLYRLVSGHPYLVRLCLHELATGHADLAGLEARAADEGGIFADHLQRLLVRIERDPDLCDVLRKMLRGQPCPTSESFYRLRSAGVVVGDSARQAQLRCRLYETALAQRLL